MSATKLPPIPEVAKRGSKVGWKLVGGEVPPEIAEKFHRLALAEGTSRSELARRLVTQFVEDRMAA